MAPPQEAPAFVNQEFIFIVDCSGSMEGSRIASARKALGLFVQSLEPGVPFNVVKLRLSPSRLLLLSACLLMCGGQIRIDARVHVAVVAAEHGGE